MGAQFGLDIYENADAAQLIKTAAIPTYAAMLASRSRSLYSLDLSTPGAWLFGSEGQGLRASVLAASGLQVHIPMPGATESLNVAAAAAICLFETVRRRQGAQPALAGVG